MNPQPRRSRVQRRQVREAHKATNKSISFKPPRSSLPVAMAETVSDIGKVLRPVAKELGSRSVDRLVLDLDLAIYDVLTRNAGALALPLSLKRALTKRLNLLQQQGAKASAPIAAPKTAAVQTLPHTPPNAAHVGAPSAAGGTGVAHAVGRPVTPWRKPEPARSSGGGTVTPSRDLEPGRPSGAVRPANTNGQASQPTMPAGDEFDFRSLLIGLRPD
jgi:hypothetical protein